MKLFHTADWHLGKLVQGVSMTDDQRFVLEQLIRAIDDERPDVLIIAGDIFDRSVPPVGAVDLLDELLETIVLELNTPVLAIAGNHDGPERLDFGRKIMRENGLHIVGQFTSALEPVILTDDWGEVHFHLIPYVEPSKVRYELQDDSIRTHDDAMRAICERIVQTMDPSARHVFVGHAFVTPNGEPADNTSDAERPLAIGGVEYVNASHFAPFHYTALGHLHGAHHVGHPTIRYAGSPLKYSLSEQHHQKGFYVVQLDKKGDVTVDKRTLSPLRDIRSVSGYIEEIEQHERNDDYVFVTLLDEAPVLAPMERIRAVYPNALYVERKVTFTGRTDSERRVEGRAQRDDVSLFKAFYKEVTHMDVSEQTERLFTSVLQEVIRTEGGRE